MTRYVLRGDPASGLGRLETAFWDRHANPKSGWSRVLLGPLLIVALYRRDRRLVVAVLLATLVNPILFSPVDGKGDDWMTRAVRAEQWWLESGRGTFGTDWPNALNTLNVPVFLWTLAAAWARRPWQTTVGLLVSMALKFGWVELIAQRYDRRLSSVDSSDTTPKRR